MENLAQIVNEAAKNADCRAYADIEDLFRNGVHTYEETLNRTAAVLRRRAGEKSLAKLSPAQFLALQDMIDRNYVSIDSLPND